MSDLPSIEPTRRRGAQALPAPEPLATDDVGRQTGKSEAGASSFNGALLDAIRDSSALVSESFASLTREVQGFRKDVNTHIKTLQAQAQYYKTKQAKYAKFEEDFFREGTKLILKWKGLEDKFPPRSSVYSPDYNPETRSRDSSGRFTSGGDSGSGGDSPDYKKFEQLWLGRFKTFADYAQTPIKFTDLIPAKILALISAGIAERKKAAADAAQKAEDEVAAAKKAAALAKQEAEQKAKEDELWEEHLNEYFGRLKDLLDEKWPDNQARIVGQEEEAPVAEVKALPSPSWSSGALPEGSEGEFYVPGSQASGPASLPAPEFDSDGFAWTILPAEAFEPVPAWETTAATVTQPSSLVPYGSYGPDFSEGGPFLPGASGQLFLPPPEASGGPGPQGVPGTSPEGGDYGDLIDDIDDMLNRYFYSQSLFYAAPESSPVGKWLTDLLGADKDKDEPETQKLKIELPGWIEAAVNKFLFEVGLFLLEMLPIALAIAAGIVLLSLGATAVLVAIAAAVLIIAAVVGYLGLVIGNFVNRVFNSVADLLDGLVQAVVGFINDPGAFVDKLSEGIASGLDRLLTTVIDHIAEAFDKISILHTVADAIKGLAGDVTAISSAVKDEVVKILRGAGDNISLISGTIAALLTIVGGSILKGIIDTSSFMAGLGAWIMAGGLFGKDAGKAYDQAVLRSSASQLASIREVANMKSTSTQTRDTLNALANRVENSYAPAQTKALREAEAAMLAAGRSTAGMGQQTNVTNIQHISAFATIPVMGAY